MPEQLIERPELRSAIRGTLTADEEPVVTAALERHHSELMNDLGDLEFDPVAREPVFERANEFARDRALREIGTGQRLLRLDLAEGSVLTGPPYDLSWHLGNGGPLGRVGELFTASGEPESTSGAGIVVDNPTSRTLHVSVTPIGHHRYSWIWADAHGLSSRGGLATVAYRSGDPSPVFTRRATLWNVSGGDLPNSGNVTVLPTIPPAVLAGETGEGPVGDASDTVRPPLSFRFPVAPITFYAEPGERHIVWIWLWQMFRGDDRGFLALHTATVNGFAVSSAPPTVLH
ncbi:hypothetical protein [Nocardia xishanensis]